MHFGNIPCDISRLDHNEGAAKIDHLIYGVYGAKLRNSTTDGADADDVSILPATDPKTCRREEINRHHQSTGFKTQQAIQNKVRSRPSCSIKVAGCIYH